MDPCCAFSTNRNTARGSLVFMIGQTLIIFPTPHFLRDLSCSPPASSLFILYIVTVAHTFDHMHRSYNRTHGVKLSTGYQQLFCTISLRSSSFVPQSSASYLNHHYKAKLESSSTITGVGSKMVVLKMRCLTLFDFKPDQHAFVRLLLIDSSWHPFSSIASGPESPFIEFYIEGFDEQSWTGKLWQLINDNRAEEGRLGSAALRIDIDLMGPYDTGLVRKEDFSHALLAVGTGTGT
jgi:hypothetical protein